MLIQPWFIAENGRFRDSKTVNARPIAPRICSMYGDLLSYPVDDAGVATRAEMGRSGARCAARPAFQGAETRDLKLGFEIACRAMSHV